LLCSGTDAVKASNASFVSARTTYKVIKALYEIVDYALKKAYN